MPNNPDGKVHIGFINVGMGDCTVIKGPKGEIGIIDCGSKGGYGNSSIDSISSDIKSLLKGDPTYIDFVLITHSDADHYNLLGSMLGSKPIGTIYHADALSAFSDNTFRQWYYGMGSLKGRKMNAKEIKAINLNGSKNDNVGVLKDWSYNSVSCKIEILAANVSVDPQKNPTKAYTTNTKSAVVKVVAGGLVFLIAGDATNDTEGFLIKKATGSNANYLKSNLVRVGHHGSNSSSSQGFVDKVAPNVAIISSAAENAHHLPKTSVVSRWISKLPTSTSSTTHNIVHYNDLSGIRKLEPISKDLFITDLSGTQTYVLPSN